MKKIFVTGGGGYVGAVLIPKLLDENYEVTVLDLFILTFICVSLVFNIK